MTSNQLKAKELAQKESQFARSHTETKRSNRANEAIGRTQAAASVAKSITSPFKIKLNHIDWYKHSPTQLEAVAKLPYTKVKGSLRFCDSYDGGKTITTKGLMMLYYVDTLPIIGGIQGRASSPVNIIAQNLFSKLRSKVSGSITFEAADYMMYIMSVGSYYGFWSYLCRLYNIMNSDLFKDSLYLKSQLITEMGYQFNDLDSKKLLLLSKINEFGSILANFAIPNELDYFKRKLWLTSNVFVDHKDCKYGSFYMLNPTHTFVYSDGLLSELPLGGHSNSSRWSLAQLVAAIDTVINSMTNNESWIDMSGQTKRAYEGVYFTFPTLKINEEFTAIYDTDILRQIQSADISIRPLTLTIAQITDPESVDYGVIYQGTSNDGLDFNMTSSFRSAYDVVTINDINIRNCIFSDEDEVSVDDVARQTRLKSRVRSSYSSGKQSIFYESVPTELVVGVTTLNTDGTVNRFEQLPNSMHAWTDLSNYIERFDESMSIHVETQFRVETIKQIYHYCPILFATNYYAGENDSTAQNLYYFIPYVNNTIVTSCDDQALDAINRVCISSMLGLFDNLGK